MKAIFCGNFDYEARQSDLERLFRKYGKVDRVDMKSGKFGLLLLVRHCIVWMIIVYLYFIFLRVIFYFAYT